MKPELRARAYFYLLLIVTALAFAAGLVVCHEYYAGPYLEAR